MADPRPSGPVPAGFGVNLIGYATANLGLGTALRNTAAILAEKGIPFAVRDIDPGGGRSGKDLSLRDRILDRSIPLPHPVNLFHLNPPEVRRLLERNPESVPVENRLNASVPFWELESLPPSWIPMLEAMDLNLAPSRFIQKALETQVKSAPALYFRQALASLPTAQADRKRWSFPDRATVFAFSFDIASSWERKNPVAAIRAFKAAFGGSPDALLILKLNNKGLNESSSRAAEGLKQAARHVPGLRIVDEPMSYAEVLSLYASADVFVSPHRGEGLGLGLLESMSLGKPVIATGYSGNMDFMDAGNSCLVGYGWVPLDPDSQYAEAAESRDLKWPDPSVEEIAAWMARLAGSRELRESIGRKARATAEAVLEEARRGEVFDRIRGMWMQGRMADVA